ncbi:AAA family ATPase, partial [Candidatus Poribacteria bacterium]|nr:AAA family ATPase [Candidatus Poribacteria bacterium]
MVKIAKIEIKNFKVFRGEPYVFDLSQKGLNLILYGENGSGKTSLYKALEYFFESSEGDFRNFATYQNRFDKDNGYVRLHFTSDTNLPEEYYEWSENPQNDTRVEPIIDASRTKVFLDYKDLLKTNYLHASEKSVDVYDLLVKTLLKNIINVESRPPRSFAEQWQDISDIIFPEQETEQVVDIPQ